MNGEPSPEMKYVSRLNRNSAAYDSRLGETPGGQKPGGHGNRIPVLFRNGCCKAAVSSTGRDSGPGCRGRLIFQIKAVAVLRGIGFRRGIPGSQNSIRHGRRIHI
jgi:hypothetical protein